MLNLILDWYQHWAMGTNQPRVKQCVAFDKEHDHYFWFHVGWDGKR